jgi:Glutathione S-transferase, N-terminal domain
MAVKLHRCSTMWIKGPHPCWKVQKALDDAGVEYTIVMHPGFRRSKRTEYIALTGQKLLPALQLEDGTIIRRESKELVQLISSGELDKRPAQTDGAPPSDAAATA